MLLRAGAATALAFSGALLLGGCATGPVNTDNPTTSDLLFRYSELEAYLDVRRDQLAELEGELADLSDTLAGQEAKLGEIRGVITGLRLRENESEEDVQLALIELADLEAQRIRVADALLELERERDRMLVVVAEAEDERREDLEKRAQLEYDISRLTNEVNVIQAGIDRFVSARQIQLLKS